MSNHWFKFKQFTIQQDRCAMKVGTDAILLGAWCDVKNKRTALDIGTGTGILALMIAQRNPHLRITAIDIDQEAILQARENVASTPFAERITLHHADFTRICSPTNDSPSIDFPQTDLGSKYDLLISNPPYHEEEVFCPDDDRNNARHTSALSFENFCKFSSKLLEDSGTLSVIIPTIAAERFINIASQNNLTLKRRTDIFTTPKKQPKRTLLEFTNIPSDVIVSSLFIRNENNDYTDEYIRLTQDFYLDNLK